MQVEVYNEHKGLSYSGNMTGCFCLHADVPNHSGFQQNYMAIIFTNADALPSIYAQLLPRGKENYIYINIYICGAEE